MKERSPEYRARKAARQAVQRRERYQTDPEYRAREVARQKERQTDPEYRARQATWARKRYQTDPEYRARKAAREKNPEYRARQAARWAAQKGFTPELEVLLVALQGGVCATCGEPWENRDHAHETPPRPRGLLCWLCNVALGRYESAAQNSREADPIFDEYLAHPPAEIALATLRAPVDEEAPF